MLQQSALARWPDPGDFIERVANHFLLAARPVGADRKAMGLVAQALEQMRQGYWETAQRMPTHGEFLAKIAPQPKPAAAPADALPSFSFAEESPFAVPGSPV